LATALRAAPEPPTWGTKDGDNDMLPDVEDEQTEYSDEIPNEFDAENDEDALKEIDANLELEEYVEELSETGESEEITESNEFKLPMFKYNLNDGNTEGLSGMKPYTLHLYMTNRFLCFGTMKREFNITYIKKAIYNGLEKCNL
jgi:hypothetical protein